MGNIFDILGPVMVGPSSSHTAGAARIGLIARQLSEGSLSVQRSIFMALLQQQERAWYRQGTDRRNHGNGY